MEHLPVPNTARPQEGVVPYVYQKGYDGGPFLTYPIREGMPHLLPTAGAATNLHGTASLWHLEKLRQMPKQELESFLQIWLFFGLIHEVLGNLCSLGDFVRTAVDGNTKFVSTSKLPKVIESWLTKVNEGAIIQTYEHIAGCLRVTSTTLRAARSIFNPDLLISIASTGEMLEYATNKAFHIEDLSKDNKCLATWRSLFEESVWTSSMQAAGWCPSQIKFLFNSALSIQSLYYYTCLGQSESPDRHQLCDQRKCTSYQNNLGEYKTRHVDSDYGCEELSINVTAMDEILRGGCLPLLRILLGQTLGELAVEVVESQPTSRYVALSHVWADGLGNPVANALPRCQLRLLHNLLYNSNLRDSEDAQEDLLLWCDTLCCPVKPEEAKRRALSLIKRTYRDATYVLVLDASLQSYDSNSMTIEEICFRIIASGWMRRLWTPQEGALPTEKGRLWFQFHDQAIKMSPLRRNVLNTFNSQVSRRGIAGEILVRIRPFTIFFKLGLDTPSNPGADLAFVDAAFQHRSVSVSSDEPLLISTLLNIDVEKILDGPDESRMRRLWTSMHAAPRSIPKNILFRLGPRIKDEGFRWAPSTLLYYEESNIILQTMLEGKNQGIPTARGLEVRLPGCSLSWPKRPVGLPSNPWNIINDKHPLYMRDEHGSWYAIARRISITDPLQGDFLSDDNLHNTLRSNADLRIINLETVYQARLDASQYANISLLVEVVAVRDNINFVRSRMYLHVMRLQVISQTLQEAAYHCAQ